MLGGCTAKLNYSDPLTPRYAGIPPANAPAYHDTDTLRVVTFNIEFAYQVDSAIAVLTGEAALQNADVVLLQEMDEISTARVAQALGMWHVYYPATLHPRTKRDMGNAVLSRWPIIDDAKILLPHVSRLRRTQRAATAASIQVGDDVVRVYSAHLGTPVDVSPAARRNQLRAVLEDARKYERVIIGGDMNNKAVGRVAQQSGYAWPTRDGPRTVLLGRWDHIFMRGLNAPAGATGTVPDSRGASDHLPVWALAILP